MIYAQMTPWGLGKAEGNDADLGPFWAASGFAATMAGNAGVEGAMGSPATMPLQLGELSTGVCLLAGVGAAIFHRARTGAGQRVHTSLLQTGVWVNQMMAAWCATVESAPPSRQLTRSSTVTSGLISTRRRCCFFAAIPRTTCGKVILCPQPTVSKPQTGSG
jgi:crotonobetainyl-CoA:carnitine CoA-transferase CaiB-like acyl-CoA transferase